MTINDRLKIAGELLLTALLIVFFNERGLMRLMNEEAFFTDLKEPRHSLFTELEDPF